MLGMSLSPVAQAVRGRRLSELRALIRDLFGDGQNGLAFVPQPLLEGEQTLYQLDNGTTLTDAHGDPVGLGLEWSRGLELGPELLTNGTFDTDSDWTKGAGWSISGGTASLTGGESTSDLSQSVAVVDGNYYLISFEITSISSNGRIFIVDPAVEGVFTSTGVHTLIVKSSDSRPDRLSFRATSSDGLEMTASLDNASIRELPGNHLTQSVSADRPTYNTDGALHWLKPDGVDDTLAATSYGFSSNGWSLFAAAGSIGVVNIGVHSDPGSGSAVERFVLGSSGDNYKIWSQGKTVGTGDVIPAPGSPHVIGLVCDASGTLHYYFDGVLVYSVTPDPVIDYAVPLRPGIVESQADYPDKPVHGVIAVDYDIGQHPDKLSSLTTYLGKLAGITL